MICVDRRTEPENKTQEDMNAESDYITDKNGIRVRMPYKTIKLVEFDNLDPKELIDIPHSARVQYRLLLMDAVLRAKVEFVKRKATVIYNHPEAKNYKDKINQQQLIEFFEKEGIHVDRNAIKERDYDYVKEHYTYAFEAPEIRESVPYGYTKEEWHKYKEEAARKKQEERAQKLKATESGEVGVQEDDEENLVKGVSDLIKQVFAKFRSINN